MLTQAIHREDWVAYFNLLSQVIHGRHVQLELIGEDVGDQIEEDWSQLDALHFDLVEDTLYVRTDITEIPIFGPQSVMIQEDGVIRTIGIKDEEGDLQILHFRDPLLLVGQ